MIPTSSRREDEPNRAPDRSGRLRAVIATIAITAGLLGATNVVVAEAPSRAIALDPAAFTAVDPQAYAIAPAPSVSPKPARPPAAISDFSADRPIPADVARDRYGQPDVDAEAPLRALVKATPRPKAPPEPRSASSSSSAGRRVGGTATWYCKAGVSVCHHAYSGGMYAAAGAELRIGDWRGRTVTVCGGGDCIRVKLIDWCACQGARIIDLYSDAYRRLAPLSTGTMKVTVRW